MLRFLDEDSVDREVLSQRSRLAPSLAGLEPSDPTMHGTVRSANDIRAFNRAMVLTVVGENMGGR